MTDVHRIAVVVPARDEQAHLDHCLRSLHTAARHVRGVAVSIIVVLDRCVDRSAEIVAAWPDVTAVRIDAGAVGTARAIGISRALEGVEDPASIWLACTDADSRVPSHWLAHQLAEATRGADLYLGLVRPDPEDLPADLHTSWLRNHRAEIARAIAATGHHQNVHGANMGFRGDRYLQAGGFPMVAEHEDRRLSELILAVGGHAVYPTEHPVLTSGRRIGRTPGGFAGFLRQLAERPSVRLPA